MRGATRAAPSLVLCALGSATCLARPLSRGTELVCFDFAVPSRLLRGSAAPICARRGGRAVAMKARKGSKDVGKAGPSKRDVPNDSLGLDELRAAVRSIAADLEQLYRYTGAPLTMDIDIVCRSFGGVSAMDCSDKPVSRRGWNSS
jgi:hypothetical protein